MNRRSVKGELGSISAYMVHKFRHRTKSFTIHTSDYGLRDALQAGLMRCLMRTPFAEIGTCGEGDSTSSGAIAPFIFAQSGR